MVFLHLIIRFFAFCTKEFSVFLNPIFSVLLQDEKGLRV